MKSKKGALPNLIIIGAQKCGTTSLHYYLGLHPQISMSREKELDFFIIEHNWHKGIDWYKSNFIGETKIRGESSPNYTLYPYYDGVPERMHSVVPGAKLIYILRDPIDRIISHYIHNCTFDELENRKISDVLTDLKNNLYICRSKYYMQLEQYLNNFPKSNVLIITVEDLYEHRQQTLQKIFNFLNVDETFYSNKFFKIKHKTTAKRRKNRLGLFLENLPVTNIIERFPPNFREYSKRMFFLPFSSSIERPELDDGLRQKLIDELKDDINCLRQFTGYDFKGWCL